MKRYRIGRVVVITMFVTVFASGCVTVRMPQLDALREEIKNLPLDSLTRTISHGLVAGLKDSLLDPKTTARLDSIVAGITRTVVSSAQDTILDGKTRMKIDSALSEFVSTLTGTRTRMGIDSMIFAANKTATPLIAALMKNLTLTVDDIVQHHVLGDSTLMKIDSFREHMAGEQLARNIRAIMDTVNGGIAKTEQGVVKTGNGLIWGLAAAIAALMGFGAWLWFVKRRYQKMSEVITHAIHYMPNQDSYDELTDRINVEAKRAKVEPHLQKLLKKQGILGAQNWRSAARRVPSVAIGQTGEVAAGPTPADVKTTTRVS